MSWKVLPNVAMKEIDVFLTKVCSYAHLVKIVCGCISCVVAAIDITSIYGKML